MLKFNVAVPFPSGACGSLGCHSVASPPRGRPWRLSPLVVQWIIPMSVITALLLTSSNANGCSCVSLYYVLILLGVLLYRILRQMFFIPRFAEIWGPTSICGSARALYRALVRPEGRAFISQYGEPAKLCQDEPATTSSARFISTSDADKPPQKCVKGKAVWRLESSSPENFGDSAILPTAKISASLIEILSSRSHKTPACYAPNPTGAMIVREQAVPRPMVSAFRPRHNIIRARLWNKSRASCDLLPQSLLC